MPAYVIVEVEILDTAAFDQYRQLVPPTIAAFGGRYLARGGRTELFEGGPPPRRTVLLEFPSLTRAQEWFASEAYRPARAIRERAARVRMLAVEGVPD